MIKQLLLLLLLVNQTFSQYTGNIKSEGTGEDHYEYIDNKKVLCVCKKNTIETYCGTSICKPKAGRRHLDYWWGTPSYSWWSSPSYSTPSTPSYSWWTSPSYSTPSTPSYSWWSSPS